ncbi:transcription factor 24-like [Anneissia japonica]|uniref:transcription factor 24-like n=1 Tax=Anneissia japonica TaxID=1529436 RepID=UPI001425B357|nr:transcription factor 24-like [Anneissia japonica]
MTKTAITHGQRHETHTEEAEKPKRGRKRGPRKLIIHSDTYDGSSGDEEQHEKKKGRGRSVGANAARERSRVKTLRDAFLDLQRTLPSVPPDTKLSKLDVLVLATTYIAHLMRTLDMESGEKLQDTERQHRLQVNGYLHPVKKWPMRSRLYVGAMTTSATNQQNL